MAATDLLPASWISGWSEDGTDITIPLASIAGLTAAEADASTGDIRKVAFSLIDKLYKEYLAMATADRPTKMTIAKSASTNTETGVVTNAYTFRFYTEVTAEDVVDEPA